MADYKVIDKRGKDKEWDDRPTSSARRAQTLRAIQNATPKVYNKPKGKKRPKRITGIKLHCSPGRMIVREDDFQYEGRIIIPDSSERRPTTGVIIAVGANLEWDKLKKGAKVVYGMYSGTVINIRHQPVLRILGEAEILTIVEGEVTLEGVGV